MIPRPLYDAIRTLHAPGAKTLREKWFRTASSGAKITIAEAERLYAIAGAQLKADVDIEVTATRMAAYEMELRTQRQKRQAKARRRKKQ